MQQTIEKPFYEKLSVVCRWKSSDILDGGYVAYVLLIPGTPNTWAVRQDDVDELGIDYIHTELREFEGASATVRVVADYEFDALACEIGL